MNLKQHISELCPDDREKFATDCKTTLGHLRNVMYGYRPCSAELASAVERVSGGAVTRQVMRPDDWQEVWPELATMPANQAQAATGTIAAGG